MERFSIILGLCRAAMQTQNPAVVSQIQRLAKALEEDSEPDQAASLRKLLAPAKALAEISPSRVVLSRAALYGEMLTPSVQPPVDKETGAPLAEIVHLVSEDPHRPLFNPTLATGIETLLQEWQHVDELRTIGVRPALATMLFGAPGTGKTMLAKYIAAQLGLPLVIARLDGLISSFLGTTARNISTLFSFANRYKCVLLLDEFDAVAKLRDDPHELGEIKRVVNTLLQCIDSRSALGFTIAITNHESLLDPAVWRRFDIRIEIPKPDVLSRIEILQRQFNKGMFDESHLRFLAWITEGGSGSDIEKLADFLKRQKVIQKSNFDFFSTVRNYVQMSAHEGESHNRSLIVEDQEQLAQVLIQDTVIPFNQTQLAILFGCTQPKISRMLKGKISSGGK